MTALALRSETRTAFDYTRLDRSQARFAEKAAERIRAHQRAAVIDIGRELLSVKDRLEHGDFIAWIEAECGFGRRTAVNLMHVAQSLGGKWESVSHLPPGLLYALAAPSTPDDFRQQVLDVAPSDRLDARSLRIHLSDRKRRDAANKAKQRAKELTKGQKTYKRRQEKLALQNQQKRDAERLEKTRQADIVADLIADALGSDKSKVLAELSEIDPYRLLDALRRRLVEKSSD